MKTLKKSLAAVAACLALGTGMTTPARAQIPVTDLVHIGVSTNELFQQIQQVLSWVAQYTQMVTQITNQYEQIRSATGSRGMENLLMSAVDQNARRYLPSDMADIYSMYSGTVVPGYGAVSARINALRGTISSLPAGTFPTGSAIETAINNATNQLAASRAIGEASYRAVTDRIGSTENLISTIGSTADEKGIAELAARIQGEQVLAQNESNRIALLAYQERIAAAQADRRSVEAQIQSSRRSIGGLTFTGPGFVR
jgi:type IV secretion system protein VirB5